MEEKTRKKWALILVCALVAGILPMRDASSALANDVGSALSNPRIVENGSMNSGQKVTWDCVYFGSYPQAEIIGTAMSENYTAIESTYLKDGDLIVDDDLYDALVTAPDSDWNTNGDITLNGSKYRRIRKEDATSTAEDRPMHNWPDYIWLEDITWHYFKYEPIKWRVLSLDGSMALLLSDVALDNQRYEAETEKNTTWEKSIIRSWLNGYDESFNQSNMDYSSKNFIDSAFTGEEQAAVIDTNVVNAASLSYGTDGGNDTKDKIFLLSESEIYGTEKAQSYGFASARNINDEARCTGSSTYAKAMGTFWDDNKENYKGNSMWWLRSPGEDDQNVIYVGSWGSVILGGKSADYGNFGVRPALNLDLNEIPPESLLPADTVCSDGTCAAIEEPTPSPAPSATPSPTLSVTPSPTPSRSPAAASASPTPSRRPTSEMSLEEYVVAALEDRERMIDVSAYNVKFDKGRTYRDILDNNPQLFYVPGGLDSVETGFLLDQDKYWFPTYMGLCGEQNVVSEEEVIQMREELETAVQKVLEQVDESMDAVQKALVVHDYLIQNCKYDQEKLIGTTADTSYGALVKRMARCNGYAYAYAYIMDYKLGIPCKLVDSPSMDHTWNMIEIDGEWYNVDLTYDDPAWDRIGRVNHNYFLLSDKTITQNSPHYATGNNNHYGRWQDYTADSERYDQEFWTDVESAISYYNGAWYYSEYDSAGNKVVLKKKTDLFGSNAETVYETSPWQASGQSSDPINCMYLAQADGKLYFNTGTGIMQMDADGKIQAFYEPDGLAGKQIFGFTVQDGEFLYAPDDVYDTSKKQSGIRRYLPGGEDLPFEEPQETPSSPEDKVAKFWADVEEKEQLLQKCKDKAIAEINDNYGIKVGTYYWEGSNDDLQRLIDDLIDKINRTELPVYADPVAGDYYIEGSVAGCAQGIELKIIQADLDTKINQFDWSDLLTRCLYAKKELDNYKDPNDYRPAQQRELENAIEAGKTAIDEAKNAAYVSGNPTYQDPVSAKKEVERALEAAKAEIDKIKTDAQLEEEEKADKTEDKTDKTEGKTDKTEDKTDKTEGKTDKTEGKTDKTEGKTDKTDTTSVSTAPSAGTSFKKGQHTYKVLKKDSTVAFTKTKSTAKSISVPATITYGGITYKVTAVSGNAFKNNKKVTKVKLGSNITAIGVSAFRGCKKLKTITISSKQLKTVGKKAFKGIYAKAKIKVPSSKKKAYKKLLKGKGLSKKAKIV